MIKHTINGDLKHELFSLQNPEPSHENSKKRKPKNKRNFIHIQNGPDRIEESKDQVRVSMTKEKERAALLPDTFKPLAQKQYRIIENFEPKVLSKFQKLKFKMKKCSSKISTRGEKREELVFSQIDSVKRNKSGVEFINLERPDLKVHQKSFKTQHELLAKLPRAVYQNNTIDNSPERCSKAFGRARHSDVNIQKITQRKFNKSGTYEGLKVYKAVKGKSLIECLNQKIRNILASTRINSYDDNLDTPKKQEVKLKPQTRRRALNRLCRRSYCLNVHLEIDLMIGVIMTPIFLILI
ncbi:unnamed protein product [Moneuplotes crassus]|uniref:Uncharacterized protein n=1 Tax=Euplotes crassus TaxID=5936 RepID=A0AAD1UCS5_EUPCR|nr:unnamed protein product [Moneuplotes crassus]